MTQTCKNLCDRMESSHGGGVGFSPYANGFRFCRTCDKFLKTDKTFCPCCSTKMRTTRLRKNNVKINGRRYRARSKILIWSDIF